MAASPIAVDGPSSPREKWQPADNKADVVKTNGGDAANGEPRPATEPAVQPVVIKTDPSRNGSAAPEPSSASVNQSDTGRGEKQIKVLVESHRVSDALRPLSLFPNKVYIGGLPEHTRKEDLEGCFGKIGNIVNIELKIGYGFVEFDSREAAEESVAKYHEGYFMGNKIRVELSHGGGRTAKYSNDPGACFKCGQVGHWARECPNHLATGDPRRGAAPLIDRIQPPRDYYPREYAYDYARLPPPRDSRYPYDYPPPPPGREFRRPPSPPRDYRDYAPRLAREPEDLRDRPPPPARLDSRPGYYPPESDLPPAGYPRYPPRDYYDRYDRRAPPADRYAPYPAPPPRGRTPPVPARRDDYDRPPRDYPPPAADYRGRPASPPPSRYADYPRAGSSEPSRYRRRSQSPPPRSAAAYDSAYPSGGPPYSGTSSAYPGGGYPREPPSRGASSARDYPPRPRDGEPGYRRI
ncbi:hypothetical protein BC629DRAFT_1591122 [Irpex lacteus]|nr:hypothetical protein BC629DRAFT_1591122 [Irpex lacteus]